MLTKVNLVRPHNDGTKVGAFKRSLAFRSQLGIDFLFGAPLKKRRHNAGALKMCSKPRGLLLLSSGQKINLKVIWSLKNKENWKFPSLFDSCESFFCVFQVIPSFVRMYIDLGSIAVSAEIQNQQQPNSSWNERLRASQTWFADDLTFHSLPFAEALQARLLLLMFNRFARERLCCFCYAIEWG